MMIKLKELDKVQDVMVVPQHKLTTYKTLAGPRWGDIISIEIDGLDYRIIKKNVEAFLKYAIARPSQTFYIVGDFTPAIDFAPMFANAPYNCVFSKRWFDILGGEEHRKWWAA
jgi:hypothetical protein